MIGRILVPLDTHAGALRALGPGRRLADRLDVELDVVTWSFSRWYTPWARRRVELHLQRHAVDRRLDVLTTDEQNAGIAVAAAATERAACVVMATHARSGPGRTLLGSVAEEVLTNATGPVVLVGSKVRSWSPTGRVVVGLDPDLPATPSPSMSAWAGRLDLPLEVASAADADVFARAATDRDLLVVATHGRRGLSRAVLGSVAMRVVHEAPCPVAVISRAEAWAESAG